MRFRLIHRTSYAYSTAVHESFNEVRLRPASDKNQTCLNFTLTIDPGLDVNTGRRSGSGADRPSPLNSTMKRRRRPFPALAKQSVAWISPSPATIFNKDSCAHRDNVDERLLDRLSHCLPH